MQKDNYWRRAKLKGVQDGDTIRLLVDLGYRTYLEYSIRLEGIISPKFFKNFPEEERMRGIRARNLAVQWFRSHSITCSTIMEKWPLVVYTSKSDGGDRRYLGKIYCNNGHCLNEDLLETGLFRPFVGEAC